MNTSTMFARVFGSLNNAYKAAGFTRIRIREYSAEEVIEQLRQLTEMHGRELGWNDIEKGSKAGLCPGATTVRTRFRTIGEVRTLVKASQSEL